MVLYESKDDMVQINVYGATLAVMLQKGVNILQLLAKHGFTESVIFDVPRKTVTAPQPCQAVSEYVQPLEVKEEEDEVEEVPRPVRSSTPIPVATGQELMNCTLSTIQRPEDASPTFLASFKEEPEREEARQVEETVGRVPIVPEESRDARLTNSAADYLLNVCPARSSHKSVKEEQVEEISTAGGFSNSVAGCLSDVLAQVCATSFKENVSSEPALHSPVACLDDTEPALFPPYRSIDPDDIKISSSMDVGDGSQRSFDSADDVKYSIPNASPSISISGQDDFPAAADPSTYPEAFDFVDDGFPVGLEKEGGDSEQMASASSPRSDDEEEFFDCSFGEDFEADGFGDEEQDLEDKAAENKASATAESKPSEYPSPPAKKRAKLDVNRGDAKYLYCQYAGCHQEIVWKPTYGTARFLRHVKTHVTWPTLRCGLCFFKGAYQDLMRYHHKRQHPGEKWVKPQPCEEPGDSNKLLALWKECFPSLSSYRMIGKSAGVVNVPSKDAP